MIYKEFFFENYKGVREARVKIEKKRLPNNPCWK